MRFVFQPHALILFLTAATAAIVAWRAWLRRLVPAGKPLFWLMVSVSVWALTAGLELMAVGEAAKIFWSQVCYLGTVGTPLLFLIFALTYSQQRRWLKPRILALLWLMPALTLIMAFTNGWHHLVWNSFTPSPAGQNILIYGHGPWFWAFIGYSYIMVFAGTLLLFRELKRRQGAYRREALILVIGSLFPWIGSVIYVSGLSPLPGLDITPISFAITGSLLAWGILRRQILNLVPVAREVVLDSMSDGVVVLDAEGRIVDINPAARRMLWPAPVSPIGQPARAVISTLPDILSHYRNIEEAQAELVVETDGKRYLDLKITPLRDVRGNLTGRLIVLRDITERKQAEEALKQINLELQARNEELDAFAHMVAHDLRSPLNQILGYAELLASYESAMSAEERRDSLRTIVRVTDKMSHILDELLHLAEIRQKDIHTEPLAMETIIAEAWARLSFTAEEYQAELKYPPYLPVARGYGPWIEEVWFNYLSNACKYGGHPPRLEAGGELLADGMARFWVRDNGDGIPADKQPLLFKPFTRLDQVRARGHGLGLSIVRRIVEKLGGQVGVESDGLPGHGSTFYFTLPAAE